MKRGPLLTLFDFRTIWLKSCDKGFLMLSAEDLGKLITTPSITYRSFRPNILTHLVTHTDSHTRSPRHIAYIEISDQRSPPPGISGELPRSGMRMARRRGRRGVAAVGRGGAGVLS